MMDSAVTTDPATLGLARLPAAAWGQAPPPLAAESAGGGPLPTAPIDPSLDSSHNTRVLLALQAGRRALAKSAQRPLGALIPPDSCGERLCRAETLVRTNQHAPANFLWRLPERLRLIELTLHGAEKPTHQPSWQRAEFELLLALGNCAQAHANWQDAAEDFVILGSLMTQASAWSVSNCGIGPWVDLRRKQMATLGTAMHLARAELEASTLRLSADPVVAETAAPTLV